MAKDGKTFHSYSASPEDFSCKLVTGTGHAVMQATKKRKQNLSTSTFVEESIDVYRLTPGFLGDMQEPLPVMQRTCRFMALQELL